MRRRFFRVPRLLRTHRVRPRFELPQVQSLAAIIQSIALAAAAIIGGFWTRHAFQVTREDEALKLEPRLEISIETEPLKVPGAGPDEHYIAGSIKVKNVGTANTLLKLDKPPIRIHRVTVLQEEQWSSPVRELHLQTAPRVFTEGLMCHPGATTHADFVALIGDPGLYVVTFSAVRSEAEAATAKSLGAVIRGPKGRIEWQAQHYFTVE